MCFWEFFLQEAPESLGEPPLCTQEPGIDSLGKTKGAVAASVVVGGEALSGGLRTYNTHIALPPFPGHWCPDLGSCQA